MGRFVGRSAEKRFSALCSDNEVTCNEPREDDHGWDHIVEFPYVPAAGVPADMQRPLPPSFVQTKSHVAHGLRVSMRFSNALKLARSPSPCFVLLLNRDKDGNDIWHAVHFWDLLSARALKRAREATRDGIPEDRFNDMTFSFMMTGADRRTNDDLLPWMASTVRDAGPDYAVAKVALHGAPEIVGMLKVGPLNSIEELIDHQLGLTASIPMASIQVNVRRFGVDLPFPLPVPDGPATFASMQSNPSAVCDIRLRGPDGRVIELVGDVIVPAIPGIPEDKKKVRIRARFFDIIWSLSGKMEFKLHFDTSVKVPLAEIEKVARFLSWSGQGDIDLRVAVGDKPILGALSRLDPMPEKEFYDAIAQYAEVLLTLSGHLKTNIPEVSVDDIVNSDGAMKLHGFMTTDQLNANMELFEGQPFREFGEAVASCAAEIGGWVFAAIQRFAVTNIKIDDRQVSVAFGPPTLIEAYAFPETNEEAVDRLMADFNRHISKQGVLGIQNIHAQITLPSPAGS